MRRDVFIQICCRSPQGERGLKCGTYQEAELPELVAPRKGSVD